MVTEETRPWDQMGNKWGGGKEEERSPESIDNQQFGQSMYE